MQDMTEETRTCNKCGETKVLRGNFYPRASCKGGYRPICNKCTAGNKRENKKETPAMDFYANLGLKT